MAGFLEVSSLVCQATPRASPWRGECPCSWNGIRPRKKNQQQQLSQRRELLGLSGTPLALLDLVWALLFFRGGGEGAEGRHLKGNFEDASKDPVKHDVIGLI